MSQAKQVPAFFVLQLLGLHLMFWIDFCQVLVALEVTNHYYIYTCTYNGQYIIRYIQYGSSYWLNNVQFSPPDVFEDEWDGRFSHLSTRLFFPHVWRNPVTHSTFDIYYNSIYSRRKFRSQTSDNMDRWKAEQGRGREKRKIRREKIRRERVRRKKMQMREKIGKSRNTVFFQWFGAPEGRKVGSLKRRVRSQLARWEMKKCTPLWREAHFQVKMYKTHQLRTTFGSCDVEKVHAVVARSTFRSQNVQSTPFSDHFWKLRCRKSARRCGAKHISKSKCTKRTILGPLLEVQMSKKCTPLWREAHFEVKMLKTLGVRTTFVGSDVPSLRFTTLHYIHYTTLPSTTLHNITLHYTTTTSTTTTTQLHSTTLNYSTLHYITLHYTPLHYITLHSTTLDYTRLHYLPLHFATLHYTTLQLHNYTTTQLHSTTLPYTKLHYITLHSTTLHSATLHYTTFHYTPLH